MATGFEALGAASAVLQIVSFATDLVVVCKKIREQDFVSEDELEHYAQQISDAADRVQTRYQAMTLVNSNFSNQNLQDTSKDCKDAAKALKDEVELIRSIQAQGKTLRTIRARLKGSSHQEKIKCLENSLSMYKRILEIEMISHLCSRTDAMNLEQQEGFSKVTADVKNLITQLAHGQTTTQDLIKNQHALMHQVIVQESLRIEGAVNKHTTSQLQTIETAAESKARWNTFLKSLKFPAMNRRYNDVMESRHATFKRVFMSYQNLEPADSCSDTESIGSIGSDIAMVDTTSPQDHELTSDIDLCWASFIKWLQSDDTIFHIVGKPGSGKSTLVKFIIDNYRTRRLLQQWQPDAIIISHFFWKIGSPEQNTIKGLLCTLLYQRLQSRQELIQDILERSSRLSTYTNYHDWPIRDLERALKYASEVDTRHLCIFLDGLDEICDQDGFPALADLIKKILGFPKIKLCVSTRPEKRIVRWLEDRSCAPGILLEDLTRPEMRVFIRENLTPLLSRGTISKYTYWGLGEKLIDKAQGVFLWLHLATRSLVTGIENQDSTDLLLARVDKLPRELENLYANMWERLNGDNAVYKETAARHFHYAMLQSSVLGSFHGQSRLWRWSLPKGSNLLQVAYAENDEMQETLFGDPKTIEPPELQRLCVEAKDIVNTRSAGLLQVESQSPKTIAPGLVNSQLTREDTYNTVAVAFGRVAFIHRTAHDFLKDTESGQLILQYGSLSEASIRFRLLKGFLCALVACNSEWGFQAERDSIFAEIVKLSECCEETGLDMAVNLLDILQPLYNEQPPWGPQRPFESWRNGNVEYFKTDQPPWGPQKLFLSYLMGYPQFDDYVISSVRQANSIDLATDLLRDGYSLYQRVPSARLVEALILANANPHADGITPARFHHDAPFAFKDTAFSNLLMLLVGQHATLVDLSLTDLFLSSNIETNEALEMAIRMAKTCPDLSAKVLVLGIFTKAGNLMVVPFTQYLDYMDLSRLVGKLWVLYEANLQFLLFYLLSKATQDLPGKTSGARDLLKTLNNPLIRMRFVIDWEEDMHGLQTWEEGMCYRIPAEIFSFSANSQNIIDTGITGFANLPLQLRMSGDIRTDHEVVEEFIQDHQAECGSFEVMFLELANEGIGFYTLKQAGIEFPAPFYYIRWRGWDCFPLSQREVIPADCSELEIFQR